MTKRFDYAYLFLVIPVLRTCLPWVSFRTKAIVIVPCFILWFCCLIAKPYRINIRHWAIVRRSFWILLIMIAINGLLPLFYGGYSTDGTYQRTVFGKQQLSNLIVNMSFVFVVYYSFVREKFRELRFLGFLVLLSIVYVGVATLIYGDEVVGGASRFLVSVGNNRLTSVSATATDFENAKIVGEVGLAGYQLVYVTAFAIPGLLWATLKIHNRKIRVLCGCAAIAGMATVFKCGLQTPILTLFAGLCFLVFALLFKARRSILVLGSLAMLAVALFIAHPKVYSFLAKPLMAASEMTDKGVYKGRLVSLAEAVQGDKMTYAYERYRLQVESWEGFCEHPFIGGGTKARAGGHSELLDTMSFFGLIGLILMLTLIVQFYKFNLRLSSAALGRQWLVMLYCYLGMFIFVCITNPVNVISPCLTLLLPSVALSFDHAPLGNDLDLLRNIRHV